jgi:hypothetical protein
MNLMSKGVKRSFHQELVLNQWMMSFFSGGTLHALKDRLSEDRHEGIDDGQTGFFHEPITTCLRWTGSANRTCADTI